MINSFLFLFGYLDTIAGLWYKLFSFVLMIVVLFILPSSELSAIINKSFTKKIDDKFNRKVVLIENIGSVYIIIYGILYFINPKYSILLSLPLVPLYIIYCYFWIIYFKKYHESFTKKLSSIN